ncbi:hypothetical protein [Dyella agri]|uniref:Uncharacterized protein n=1 Tax=Dyella agri TaxID=1926869 RepID=A0ABW8KIM6_9GAMM
MRRGQYWLALALALAAAPLWARTQQPAVSKAAPKDAAAVARQRAEVQRLRHDVAAQESGSEAAAQRLKQRDAEIADLQRQLQAAQQAGAATGKGP